VRAAALSVVVGTGTLFLQTDARFWTPGASGRHNLTTGVARLLP
jgi:hypothetical protein